MSQPRVEVQTHKREVWTYRVIEKPVCMCLLVQGFPLLEKLFLQVYAKVGAEQLHLVSVCFHALDCKEPSVPCPYLQSF